MSLIRHISSSDSTSMSEYEANLPYQHMICPISVTRRSYDFLSLRSSNSLGIILLASLMQTSIARVLELMTITGHSTIWRCSCQAYASWPGQTALRSQWQSSYSADLDSPCPSFPSSSFYASSTEEKQRLVITRVPGRYQQIFAQTTRAYQPVLN
jgi:hypothetical protein